MGEADDYYTSGAQNGNRNGAGNNYPMQPQQAYQGEGQYAPPSQPPPNYGQNYGPKNGYNNDSGSDKPTFDQAFKVERPRFHDIWAAILFIAVCAGFVAVSGIAIQGYGRSIGAP